MGSVNLSLERLFCTGKRVTRASPEPSPNCEGVTHHSKQQLVKGITSMVSLLFLFAATLRCFNNSRDPIERKGHDAFFF